MLPIRIPIKFSSKQLVYVDKTFAINVYILWFQFGLIHWVIMCALAFGATYLQINEHQKQEIQFNLHQLSRPRLNSNRNDLPKKL